MAVGFGVLLGVFATERQLSKNLEKFKEDREVFQNAYTRCLTESAAHKIVKEVNFNLTSLGIPKEANGEFSIHHSMFINGCGDQTIEYLKSYVKKVVCEKDPEDKPVGVEPQGTPEEQTKVN